LPAFTWCRKNVYGTAGRTALISTDVKVQLTISSASSTHQNRGQPGRLSR
jgi:hypothetical protein